MVQLIVECLTPKQDHRFIFICRKDHDEEYQLDKLFSRITTDYRKVLVDQVTEGPACSVLLAQEWYNNDDPMVTACADDYVDTNFDDFLRSAKENQAEGTIMTYLGREEAGSTAKVDESGLITEVAEKEVISPYTTVGIYYFSKGKYYVEATEQMIRLDKRANGEFYVCPVYNEMIANGQVVQAYEIPTEDMHTMGTPEGLEIFQQKLQSFPEIISPDKPSLKDKDT